MATYIPKELVFPLALTTSSTLVYTASGVTGIIKTFLFNVLVTPQRVTLLRNVAGTALVGEEIVTPGYPLRFKGWWVIPQSDTLYASATLITPNAPNFGAWGYEYS